MDKEFGQHADRVDKMVNAILFTLVGSAATVFVLQVLHVQSPSDGDVPKVLFLFQSEPISTQLAIQGVLLFATNGIVMVLCDLLPPRRDSLGNIRNDIQRLFASAVLGIRWGFVNYIAWGTFSVFVQALAAPVKDVSLAVFFTAATIGASFHCPLCQIAYYYVGERVLFGATEDDLYLLRGRAFLRLVLPNAIAGIGAGVFLAYFSAILPSTSVLTTVYSARYQVAVFLVLWLLFLWLFFYTIDQNSFMRRALRKYNVFRVWMTFFFFWLGGLLIGTEVYERLFVPHLLV